MDNPNARQTSQRPLPEYGQNPNAILYRKDGRVVTSYATYDSNGMIIKRVDMTGKPHGYMDTPHVLDYGRNYSPNGKAYPSKPRGKNATRKPRPDELQYYKD